MTLRDRVVNTESTPSASLLGGTRGASLRAVADVFASIGHLHRSLDYHLERHNVVSSNLAHVDTPGFRPSDLTREDPTTFGGALDVAMRRTDAAHFASAEALSPRSGRVFQDLSAGAGSDGNYVSLDREAAKLAANHLRFDVVSAVVSAELRSLAYAAQDGKG